MIGIGTRGDRNWYLVRRKKVLDQPPPSAITKLSKIIPPQHLTFESLVIIQVVSDDMPKDALSLLT